MAEMKSCNSQSAGVEKIDVANRNGRTSKEKPKSATSINQNTCLKIIPGRGEKAFKEQRDVTSNTKDRSSSAGSACRAPPVQRVNSSTRRTPTPTKTVILQAVRRKDDAFTMEVASSSSYQAEATIPSYNQYNSISRHTPLSSNGQTPESNTQSRIVQQRPTISKENLKSSNNVEKERSSLSVQQDHGDNVVDDDDDDQDSSSDEESIKAPNELLIEFIGCVMSKDYTNARKLCQLILLYEPENAEALSFQPVIEEKIFYDEMNANNDLELQEDEDDSTSDDDDDESDDDSSDDSSNADDEDKIDEEDEQEHPSSESSVKRPFVLG